VQAVSSTEGTPRPRRPVRYDTQPWSHQTVQWVNRELASTIADARKLLERFADERTEGDLMRRFGNLMHSAFGALRMVDIQGGTLLVEEMEAVARDMEQRRLTSEDDGLDALTRAIVQLPAYIERIIGGEQDVPLLLLPLLNDLRAVRGRPLLSESTLFILNIPTGSMPSRYGVRSREQDIREVLGRLHPHFQAALLGWLQGRPDADRCLARMGVVAESVLDLTSVSPLAQLFWVACSVVEALQDDGLPPSASVKRLMGQIERQLRRVVTAGDEDFDATPPTDLLSNLLYYVARATSTGERVTAVKQAFALRELLPQSEELDSARADLGAPSAELMETVAAAIRQDLARIKDFFESFARDDRQAVEELGGTLAEFKRVADTLRMLGLGDMALRVEGQRDALQGLIESGGGHSREALFDMAAALLEIEDHLDQALAAQSLAGTGDAGSKPVNQEYRKVVSAVVRESAANLVQVQDILTRFARDPQDRGELQHLPELMRGVAASLELLEREAAARVAHRLRRLLGGALIQGAQAPDLNALDRLADALVSLEYFMETIGAGRPDPVPMLDNATLCLDLLDPPPAPKVDDESPVPYELMTEACADSEVLAGAAPDRGGDGEQAAPRTAHTPDTSVPDAVSGGLAAPGSEVDPEVLELFLEEARDEIARVDAALPGWCQSPENSADLEQLRIAFHTLKGSGRMIGADAVSELAWRAEEVCDGLLNERLTPADDIRNYLRQVAEALPPLVDRLAGHSQGTDPRVEGEALESLLATGQALAQQRTVEVRSLALPPAAEADIPVLQPPLPSAGVDLDVGAGSHAGVDGDLDVDAGAPEDPAEAIGSEGLIADPDDEPASAPATGTAIDLPAAADAHGSTLIELRDEFTAIDLAEFMDEAGMDEAGVEARRVAGGESASGTREEAPTVRAPVVQGDVNLEARERPDTHAPEADAREETAVDAAALAPASPEPHVAADDYDQTLVEIFTEEAGDLLERADEALAQWRGDAADDAALEEMKRVLHTLKGGARMAGILPVGDVSHELESLLLRMDGGERAGPEVAGLVQSTLDRLQGMRDQLIAGQVPTGADAALSDIRSILSSGQMVAGGTAGAPTDGPQESIAELTPCSEGVAAARAAETGSSSADAKPVSEAEPGVPGATSATAPPAAVSAAAIPAAAEPAGAVGAPRSAASALVEPQERQEAVRIAAELLDELLASAGEVSILRSRLEQRFDTVGTHIGEFGHTVDRLRAQLRSLELETERQILSGNHRGEQDADTGFDPLELDRYSELQQFSRALAESVNDLVSLQELLLGSTSDVENLLVQQARVAGDLQSGLMRTRMVPFSRHVQRLQRIVRQTAAEVGKQAELVVDGSEGELDRQILERMLPPFEHMLRNAVVHGIEVPARRRDVGKSEQACITISLAREGAQMVIRVCDDGAGLDVDAIRKRGLAAGLIEPQDTLSEREVMELVFQPGFSTAAQVTQAAGRGVGMDVVASEVRRLGGMLDFESRAGAGTSFIVRLPFTLAITQALLVEAGGEAYAIPLPAVEGIVRLPTPELERHLEEAGPVYDYGGQRYRFDLLARLLGNERAALPETTTAAAILVRAGDKSTALIVDEMSGNREIVVKTAGPQLAAIRGVAGATVLGDGSLRLILDVAALVRGGAVRSAGAEELPLRDAQDAPVAMVVDDSITVRRITRRLLERNGWRVLAARDGIEAVAMLEEQAPDVMLLDIEMPRMDGYELVSHVRKHERLRHLPIVMITSRVGEKHRKHGLALGVNEYLGKPYQESQLLEVLGPYAERHNNRADRSENP
jgi:chemosensory pili system protein ChpA (sensor histidine kinase/response regulator)